MQQVIIGETGRRLDDRIRDHLYNDQSKPTYCHFSSSINSSISDFVALIGLSVINDCRTTKEMRLIHALGTLNPHGINERFTFCEHSAVPEPYRLLNNFFSHTSLSFYFPLFLHTYLIALSLILLYIAI